MSFEETGAAAMQEAEITEPQEPIETDVEEIPDEAGAIEQPSEEAAPKNKRDADSAFAEMRRENERLQQELEQANSLLEQEKIEKSAFARSVESLTGGEDGLIDLLAEGYEKSPEEIREMIEEETRAEQEKAEAKKKDEEIASLKERINEYESAAQAQEDVNRLLDINPNIKFEDLGETYYNLRKAGASAEDAYYADLARKDAHKRTPPPDIGGVKTEAQEKDFISHEEAMAMSPEERTKNWKLIRKSQEKW